uniref:Putative alpha-snap protein n=1 Tax=Culex tarsalis TaxID=7177 RepID=A0A1Q3F2C5_CULTA
MSAATFTSPETVLTLLDRFGTGFRIKEDDFFTEGNFYLKKFVKLGVVSDISKCDPLEKDEIAIVCNVPDCRYSCASVQDYECHYNSLHRFSCGECKKTLPNGHLLDLHLSETHDSYFAAQVASGKRPMFACFLEECPQRSKDPTERRDHCIKEHKFPHDFRFDKQVHTQKKPPKQRADSGEMEVEPVVDLSVGKNTKNFNFGHSKIRSFKTKKGVDKTDILESNRMVVEMLESLPK